jgi:hypothetical protein
MQGDWQRSIADLTEALAIEDGLDTPTRIRLLRDRGFAYRQIRDLDLGLADYTFLVRLGDQSATQIQDHLRDSLKFDPRSKPIPFFLFTKAGDLDKNRREVIPTPVIRSIAPLTTFMNLRFWWEDITEVELRYTNAEDAVLAREVVSALRSRGVSVGDPVLIADNVARLRRIEYWFPRPPGF